MNAPPAAAPDAAALPRPVARVLWQSALVLWLPTFVPLLTGMLRDCGHCASAYAAITPIVPGAIVPVLCGSQGVGFVVAGALPTLALFGLLCLAGRELPRALLPVVWMLVALAVGGQAVGLAYALRA